MVEIQVGRGDGTVLKTTGPDHTESAMQRYLVEHQISTDMLTDVKDGRGFWFTGYAKKEDGYSRPWNINVHGDLGLDDSIYNDMLSGATRDAADLFEDCGDLNVRTGTKARNLAIKIKKDHDRILANGRGVNAIRWLFLIRRRSTAIKGTSVIMGWWGFESYWLTTRNPI